MAKVGRPSDYDPKIHPQIVAKLAAEGKIVAEMSEIIGIDDATFYRWQNAYPEFCEAVKAGKAQPDDEIEEALYRRAKGFTYKEKSPLGTHEKVALPDTKAITFWLKNRRPEKWRDREEIALTGPVEIIVRRVDREKQDDAISNG
jgi:hypothetical protein